MRMPVHVAHFLCVYVDVCIRVYTLIGTYVYMGFGAWYLYLYWYLFRVFVFVNIHTYIHTYIYIFLCELPVQSISVYVV